MKALKITALAFGLCGFLVYGEAFAEQSSKSQAKSKLPHFFPSGVVQTQDPTKQLDEFANAFNSMVQCYQYTGNHYPLFNVSNITVPIKLYDTTMNIILDGYVRMGSGQIRVTSLCDQKFITEEEIKVLISFLVVQSTTAIDNMFVYYQHVREKAIEFRAKQLKMNERDFRKLLSLPLSDDSEVSFADVNFIPAAYERKDFVPKELHLDFTPQFIGAAAWANSGIVHYNHIAAVEDYIQQKPLVLGHELVHTNIKLQNLILSLGFNVETMASIPMLFEVENHTGLLVHPYAQQPFYELIKVFFRFDIEKAQKEIFIYPFMGRFSFDHEKLQKYSPKFESVKQELRRFFQEVTLPTFYTDPMYWSALHERMNDDNLILRVTMAQYYNQTVLGGRIETARWLSEHYEEIKRFAHGAYKKSGEAPKHEKIKIVRKLKSLFYFLGLQSGNIQKDEQKKFAEFQHKDIQRLESMSFDELLDFYFKIFKRN